MTNVPRIHHFVPQFWIRRFAGVDGRLWAYDHDTGRVSECSPKQLMQVFNLYTVQPSGIDDTSLETIDLNKVDTEGSRVFNRVLNGDLTQSAKEELATFLAVQVLRDPKIVTTYNPTAQELALSLLEVFDALDYEAFCRSWEARFPGASITEPEFNNIKSLGLHGTESALERIILALSDSEGLPELPFTDIVHQPDGRKIICDQLLRCDWTIKVDGSNRFLLGDTGVLYVEGTMDRLVVPLSSGAALFLVRSDSPKAGISAVSAADHEVANLNTESAAYSRRWVVGERSELDRVKSQVGNGVLPRRQP